VLGGDAFLEDCVAARAVALARTASGFRAAMTAEHPLDREDLRKQWLQVRGLLQAEVGETAFGTWLQPLDLADLDGDRIIVTVPTRFLRDWIASHYADRLRALWRSVNPEVRSIAIDVRMPAEELEPMATPGLAEAPGAAFEAARPADHHPADHLDVEAVGSPIDPRFSFANYVVGKPNEFAFAAAKRVAESPQPPFNPLFLYSGVGLGKTHLMHAIAAHIRTLTPGRRVVYLSAEKFMYQFIRALRTKDTMSFKEMFRSVDVLMVDDVQFISGKDSTQEEFFHTFNSLVEGGRQIVISADRSPSDLSGLEERIRSRLGWGLVADIHPTTFELRLGILQTKAEQQGVAVPERVLEFLARRITSNVRELEGALNRIVAQATLVGRAITLEMAQEVLSDLLRANDRRVTIEEIQRRVAEHYGVRLADMQSARRARAVARPRQLAMYLAKQLTPRSLPEIGRKFGGRDHTTVIHAVRRIDELRATDASLAEDIEHLRRLLVG
jgi:chromosomal replication initiator protein